MICRKCRECIHPEDNYARKATRHNYHWNCLFDGKADWEKRVILLNLPEHQLKRIPWKVAEQHGIQAQLVELVKQ